MNKTKQRREWRGASDIEFRQVGDDSDRQFEAIVCVYNVADSYGTMWRPGCFTDSLRAKLPKCVWHHRWDEPIGHVTSFDDNDERLVVTVQLDDFDAVPRARQAWAQLQSGSLDEFSFGFVRQKWVISASDEEDWAEEMLEAILDEISPVLVGAVPGTKPLAVRSAEGETVSVEHAADLAVRLAAGEIDLAEALTELKTGEALPPGQQRQEIEGDTVEGEPEETDEERTAREASEAQAVAEREAADVEAERVAAAAEERSRRSMSGRR